MALTNNASPQPAARNMPVDEIRVACGACGSLLDIKYEWDHQPVPKSLNFFEHRWSTKGTGVEGQLDFSGRLAISRAAAVLSQ